MGPSDDSAPAAAAKPKYWDARFVLTLSIIVVLIAIAAYLQYHTYPAIITGPEFNESNVTLVLSFLTFRYDVNRCAATCPGPRLVGVPALDFVQILAIIFILANLSHYWGFRKARYAKRTV